MLLLWVMKGSYFGFGTWVQVDMQARSKNTFSYNMHLFLPYLLNDSQTIRSMINFSKPLLCVTLICGDWSISFKAAFVSAVLLCVQPLPIFTAPKAAPSGKEWICIFIQTKAKIKFSPVCMRNKWAGNILMFNLKVYLYGAFAPEELFHSS